MGCCICVEESEVAIVENMGQFSRVVYPGCSPLNCWCERAAGKLSLRIEQHDLTIDTRTKDNVFVTIDLAMRVKVAESDVEFLKPKPVKRRKRIRHDHDQQHVELSQSLAKKTVDKDDEKKTTPTAKPKQQKERGKENEMKGQVDGASDSDEDETTKQRKPSILEPESESEEFEREDEIPMVPHGKNKKELLYLAYYKLKNPIAQFTAHIDNYFRFNAMYYTLDDMFAAKDEMTNDLLNKLNAKVNPFGYIVFDILVKDIKPNSKVRDAMNEVVASEKERIATVNRAQADKAAKILSAEAEARTRELEGEGIANARRAIILGLRQSVDEFQQAIPGAEAGSLLTTVLMTQYMDTIKEAASKGRNTFVLPSSPAQVGAIENQMRDALLAAERVGRKHEEDDE